jgi:hypothetical protein
MALKPPPIYITLDRKIIRKIITYMDFTILFI